MIRRHAQELLSRHEVKRLLDTMNESHPKLVEELVPKLLTLGEVQKVLQQLLREQVSIRDLGAILEVLVEAAQHSKSTVQLVEAVRQALERRWCIRCWMRRADCGCWCWPRWSRRLSEPSIRRARRVCWADGTRPAPAAFLRKIVDSVSGLPEAVPQRPCPCS